MIMEFNDKLPDEDLGIGPKRAVAEFFIFSSSADFVLMTEQNDPAHDCGMH
jgi:hypothetical protein